MRQEIVPPMVSTGVFGTVRTKLCRGYSLSKYPTERSLRQGSARPQYPTEHSGTVRHDLDTLYPTDTTVISSVRPPKISRVSVYPIKMKFCFVVRAKLEPNCLNSPCVKVLTVVLAGKLHQTSFLQSPRLGRYFVLLIGFFFLSFFLRKEWCFQ